MKEIKLKLTSYDVSLVGENYGYSVYKSNIKHKLKNLDEDIVIIFPETVECVNSNFINGLFKDIVSQYGKDEVLKRFSLRFESGLNKDLNQLLNS